MFSNTSGVRPGTGPSMAQDHGGLSSDDSSDEDRAVHGSDIGTDVDADVSDDSEPSAAGSARASSPVGATARVAPLPLPALDVRAEISPDQQSRQVILLRDVPRKPTGKALAKPAESPPQGVRRNAAAEAQAPTPPLSPKALEWLDRLHRLRAWCRPEDTEALVGVLMSVVDLPAGTHVCLSIEPSTGYYGAKVYPGLAVAKDRDDHDGWIWSDDPREAFYAVLGHAVDQWTRGIRKRRFVPAKSSIGDAMREQVVAALRSRPQLCESLATNTPLAFDDPLRKPVARPARVMPSPRTPKPFGEPTTGVQPPRMSSDAAAWLARWLQPEVWCKPEHVPALTTGVAALVLRALAMDGVAIRFHDAQQPGGDVVPVGAGVRKVLVVGLSAADGTAGPGVFAMARGQHERGRLQPRLFPATLAGLLMALVEALRRISADRAPLEMAALDRKAGMLHQQLTRMLTRPPSELDDLARAAPWEDLTTVAPHARGGTADLALVVSRGPAEAEDSGSASDAGSASNDSDSDSDSDAPAAFDRSLNDISWSSSSD